MPPVAKSFVGSKALGERRGEKGERREERRGEKERREMKDGR
jgi:hypothetical protein